MKNPLNWLGRYTNVYIDWSEYYKTFQQNCANTRNFIRDLVRKRKSGEIASTVGEGADMISLFLERPDVFSDDVIVDEVVDFFGAGTETVQNTLQTVMSHFMKSGENLDRVRKEFKEVVKAQVDANPKLKDMGPGDFLAETVNYENVQDLAFLNYCTMEALRIQPPSSEGTSMYFKEDVKLGKYHVKAYDRVKVTFIGLHFNTSQWQRASEFLPERFDSTHPLYLTPDGKKRCSASYSPFFGGQRICFGKTFAENSLKMISSYMTQYFDMEFVDKEKYANSYPIAQFF